MELKLFYLDGGNHPILGRVYHQCQEISGAGEVERYQRYLANTLSGIAQSVEDCDRIFAVIESVNSGREDDAEIEGNEVSIMISKNNVQIDIEINEDWIGKPEGKFFLNEFKVALNAWRKFLGLPQALESEVVVELTEN